jgi:tetratricopeptide (TPR) repeat protein
MSLSESWQKKVLELTQKGQICLTEGNFHDAIALFREAISLDSNPEWYYHLGVAYLNLQQWQDAVEVYQNALEIDPDNVWCCGNLGYAFLKLERWRESVLIYEKTVKFISNNCWHYHHLGDGLLQLKRWEDAVNAYQRSIALNPDSAWSYHNLGCALSNLGRWQESVIAYRHAISLNPTDWFYHNLGDSLHKQGLLEDAIGAYQHAIELQPKNIWYYDILANLFWENGQWEDAIETFIKALQIQPDFPHYYVQINKILAQYDPLDANDKVRLDYLTLPLKWTEKVCQLPENWAILSEQHPEIKKINVYPQAPISLSTSQTCQPINYFLETQTISCEGFIAEIPRGKVWADSIISGVITDDNQVVTDLSTGSAELILTSPHLPPIQYFDETVAFLSIRWGGFAYFHWMFDVISRFHLLQKSGFTMEKIDKFVVNSYQKPYEIETLTSLGIPPSKIIESSIFPYIQAKTLLVPSLSIQWPFMLSEWGCDFLKKSFSPERDRALSDLPERIYISREKAVHRRVLNEDKIITLLEKYGFKSVTLENLSVSEQAAYLGAAKVIVAPHGGGLTNLVFCQPGTKVLELFPPCYIPSFYWVISNLCQLEHYHLMGEMLETEMEKAPVGQNLQINLTELQSLLELAKIT